MKTILRQNLVPIIIFNIIIKKKWINYGDIIYYFPIWEYFLL